MSLRFYICISVFSILLRLSLLVEIENQEEDLEIKMISTPFALW